MNKIFASNYWLKDGNFEIMMFVIIKISEFPATKKSSQKYFERNKFFPRFHHRFASECYRQSSDLKCILLYTIITSHARISLMIL